MVSTNKDPVLAVVSLSGGNDGLNTVIPYNNPNYPDYRPVLGVPEDQIVPFTSELGFHPGMAPLKKYWDEGKLAIIQGIGYPNGTEQGKIHRILEMQNASYTSIDKPPVCRSIRDSRH